MLFPFFLCSLKLVNFISKIFLPKVLKIKTFLSFFFKELAPRTSEIPTWCELYIIQWFCFLITWPPKL